MLFPERRVSGRKSSTVSSNSGGPDYLIFLSLTLPRELTAAPNTMQKSHGKKVSIEFRRKITSDHFETSTNGVVSAEAGCSDPNIALDVKKRTWESQTTLGIVHCKYRGWARVTINCCSKGFGLLV